MKKLSLVLLVFGLLIIQSANATICSDSDGFDIYNKGSTTGQESFVLQDFCVGNSVSEASCLNNKQVYVQFECSSGCSDGICVHSQKQSSCEQMSNSASINGKEYVNKCLKSNPDAYFEDVLVTYSCSENSVESQTIYCGDQVCINDDVARCADPEPSHIAVLTGNPASILPDDFVCNDYGQFVELGGIQYQDSCDGFDPEYGYMRTAIDYSCNENQLARSVFACELGKECSRGQCADISAAKGSYMIDDGSGFVNLVSVIVFLIVAVLVFFYFYMRNSQITFGPLK